MLMPAGGRVSGLKRALIITTVSGFVPQFEMNNVRLLQEMGYEVHYASNFHNPHYGSDNHRLEGTGICCHQIDFVRSPWKAGANLTAFRQLCQLLQKYPFQLVHCHTPMGGVLGRLAVKWVEHIQKNKQNGQKSVQKTEQRRQKSRQQRQDSIPKNRQKEQNSVQKSGLKRQNSTSKSGQEQQEHIQQDRPFIKKEKRPKKSKFIKLKVINPKVITPRVIYTAHGFHFYKGAPLHNWLLYYPVEWWFARFTDTLITINKEDYHRAKKFCKRKQTQVKYVPGVGIDTAYFAGKELPAGERQAIREKIRRELGVSKEETMFLSLGELSKRKNHLAAIQMLAKLKEQKLLKPFHYFICGEGSLRKVLQQQIDAAGLSRQITLLGYREDVRDLLYGADIFLFPSKQEGMPVALMEAAAAGVPIIANDIRGNREILGNGSLIKENQLKEYAKVLTNIYKRNNELEIRMQQLNKFSVEHVKKEMKKIYKGL